MKKIKLLLGIVLMTSIVTGCGKATSSNKENATTEISEATSSEVVEEKNEDTTEVDTETTSSDDGNDQGSVQKKNEDDTSINNNTNEAHSDEKDEINLNYIIYNDPKYGFAIKYPKNFSINADEDGMAVTNEEGDFYVFAYGFNNEDNETIDSMKEGLIMEGASCEDIEDGFILTYSENEMKNKYIVRLGSGSINSMIISYPSDKEEEYKSMIDSIIGNFIPGDLSKSY